MTVPAPRKLASSGPAVTGQWFPIYLSLSRHLADLAVGVALVVQGGGVYYRLLPDLGALEGAIDWQVREKADFLLNLTAQALARNTTALPTSMPVSPSPQIRYGKACFAAGSSGESVVTHLFAQVVPLSRLPAPTSADAGAAPARAA